MSIESSSAMHASGRKLPIISVVAIAAIVMVQIMLLVQVFSSQLIRSCIRLSLVAIRRARRSWLISIIKQGDNN
jgi:hypothetical protein